MNRATEIPEFQTLAEIVKSFLERPDREAIRYFTGFRIFRYSYGELHNLACRCVALFREMKIAKGDRILVWAANSPEWAVIYCACVLSGVVLVPIDARNTPEFVQKIVEETEAKLLIRTQFKKESNLSTPTFIIESLFKQLRSFNPVTDFSPISPEDCVEIIYTSGTTGTPKGVVLSHRNLASNVSDVLKVIRINGTYHLLSVLPLSHALEQTAGFWTPLAGGGTILYVNILKPSALFEVFQREEITVMVLVPRLLSLLKQRIEKTIEEKKFSGYLNFGIHQLSNAPRWIRKAYFFPIHKRINPRFHIFVSGGAALDPAVEQFWKALGFEVLQGYGLTETSPVLTVTYPGRTRVGSVGHPLERVEIRLSEGNEILARGPNVFSGYYKKPETTADSFIDGWYKTGDVGEIDPDGFLFIRSRKKDIIVTSDGLNVYPEDIERILEKQPGIKEACVIGAGEMQEQIHAVLLLERDDTDIQHCVSSANRELPPEQQIESFSRWPYPEFPKTTTLKIKKNEVRKLIAQNESSVPSDSSPAGTPLQRILCEIANVSPEALRPDSKLGRDLGLSSMDRVELISRLEEEFRIDIDDNTVTVETTVADLERQIERRESAQADMRFRRWTRSPLCRAVRFGFERIILRPLLKIFCDVRCVGLENVRNLQGPILIVSNHTSHADTPLIQTLLPPRLGRKACPAAWKEYFDTQGQPLRIKIGKRIAYDIATIFFNIFPFPQTTGFRRSMVYAGEMVDRGWSILLFPEGARTETGELGEFREGIGMLARSLQIQLLPVAIVGGEKVLRRGMAIPKRNTVKIAFGKPFPPPELSFSEIALQVKGEILQLKKELEKI